MPRKLNKTHVPANGNDNPDVPGSLPAGSVWVVERFGGIDVNTGDNKSTVYELRYGTETLCVLSVTGNTKEISLKKEIVGDGIKKINVLRSNNSNRAKDCTFWVDIYQRS